TRRSSDLCEVLFHFTAQLESNEAYVTVVKLTVTVASALQLRGLDPALGPAGIWHHPAPPVTERTAHAQAQWRTGHRPHPQGVRSPLRGRHSRPRHLGTHGRVQRGRVEDPLHPDLPRAERGPPGRRLLPGIRPADGRRD